VPEYVGRGLGWFFLHQAIALAWVKPIMRPLVNTCTLDHARALPLYQKSGFVPYAREQRYVEPPPGA
jgi:GNAT superfamily N-acetyltransferase